MSIVKRVAAIEFRALVLLGLVICAPSLEAAPESLADALLRAEAAYRDFPETLTAYNAAVRALCAAMEIQKAPQFTSNLRKLGVSCDWPKIRLPLRHVEIAQSLRANGTRAGVPVVLGYETKGAPLYPPEGLFVDAIAVYHHEGGEPRFSILFNPKDLIINGHVYPLAANHNAAGDHLKLQAKRFAKSGFAAMIRPSSALRKPQIYLLDPYDPQKIPLLMVHGLQSTPVEFAVLVNSFRNDPEIRSRYQIWQFYYASGTPVLLNALELRDSLDETLHIVDPNDRDPATRRIVVLGHSMGGVISHTLVSSSQNRLWESIFRVPPNRLEGDRATIQELERILFFRRNSRVVRVIFMAAPHRGSPLATSLVGYVGDLLTRLSPLLEHGFTRLAHDNPEAMTPKAAAFYKAGKFSAVRTLSPRSPALIALSKLPIEVPYHSVIGQHRPGPKERGSDGVVPYWSSHLEGAQSELIVRSGHQVFSNPEAVRETIRILHLEEHSFDRRDRNSQQSLRSLFGVETRLVSSFNRNALDVVGLEPSQKLQPFHGISRDPPYEGSNEIRP